MAWMRLDDGGIGRRRRGFTLRQIHHRKARGRPPLAWLHGLALVLGAWAATPVALRADLPQANHAPEGTNSTSATHTAGSTSSTTGGDSTIPPSAQFSRLQSGELQAPPSGGPPNGELAAPRSGGPPSGGPPNGDLPGGPTNGELTVRARQFDLQYGVNAAALPLTEVELWYRHGFDAAWRRFGLDEDRQSPITFQAPAEGAYAFYLVLRNPTGASGPPPNGDTPPHLSAFVDATPPVVQVHAPQPALLMGHRLLRLRWTAVDAHLTSRPIELHYRVLPNSEWLPIPDKPQSLANTGQYDWRLPESVAGAVEIRVTARDCADNASTAVSAPVNVSGASSDRPGADTGAASASAASPPGTASSPPRTLVVRPSAADVERARRLHAEGLEFHRVGQPTLAVARMRDAIALDPTLTDALVDLGGLLSGLNDSQRALEAYRIALAQDPGRRSALVGAAQVLVRRRAYTEADEYLTRAVQSNPKDVEVWMHLGDIAIYRGDEIQARDYYQRAATLDPSASTVVEAAQRRLANLTALSRNYAQPPG